MMINPILRNEIKTDSRRFRFYLLLMLYVALLGIPVLLIYCLICNEYRINAQEFISLYMLLACMQAGVLMFVVPALSASTITGEREKQTLDILLTTKMSCRSIIYGKLLGVVSKVVLLIICTMPVYAIMLFLGGIKLIDIINCNLYLIMTTIFVAAMCIWVSTMVKTTKFANVASYFIEIGLIIGFPVVVLIAVALKVEMTPGLDMNKVMNVVKYILPISPAAGYGYLLADQLHSTDFLIGAFGVRSNMGMSIPGWGISLIAEVILTVIFLEAAIKKLNPLKKNRRRTKKAKKIKKAKVQEEINAVSKEVAEEISE